MFTLLSQKADLFSTYTSTVRKERRAWIHLLFRCWNSLWWASLLHWRSGASLRVMEQVCKAEAVKIKGKGLSGWYFQTLRLTTSETVNSRVSKQICLPLGTPEESQKGGCKQDVILSNTPDSFECRASSYSVRELCYLPIRYLHCFCIAKVECQVAGPFKSLTFATLWVSFPQASNMSGRMQSQGSWRGRELSQKADFCTF